MKNINAFLGALCTLASLLVLNGCENMELEPEKVSVDSVTLNTASFEIEVGQSQTITATISPSDAENQKVIWSTSNSAVATVADGVVTGISTGRAIITAKSDDGGKTATCEVIVKAVVAAVGPATLEMYKITATTALFKGHLNVSENEIPFSSVTLYYSDEEMFSLGTAKSVSLSTFDAEQDFSFSLTDLKFGTEYSYSLLVKVKSKETYLDVTKFKTNNVNVTLTPDEESLSQWPVTLLGVVSGLSEEDKSKIELGVAYSNVEGEAKSGQGTEIKIDKISEDHEFIVRLTELYNFNVPYYYCYYIKQGDRIRYSDEDSFTIESGSFESRLLNVSDIGYDTYTLEIKVPEDVAAAGNHVHFNFGSKLEYNYNLKSGQTLEDYIKYILSSSKEHCAWGCLENSENDWFYSTGKNERFVVNDEFMEGARRVEPGELILVCAAVLTPDGEIVGTPEILEFSTKSPSPLEAEIQVEITDITAIDATIIIMPDSSVKTYDYLILSDEEYSALCEYIDVTSQLQWLITSATVSRHLYVIQGAKENNAVRLSDCYYMMPDDSKYHILIAGKGDEIGCSQCFKHVEFELGPKKRTKSPVIEVTPVPEESTHFSAAFNVKCTSYDDPASGPVVSCVSCANYVHEWLYYDDYSMLLSQSGTKFSGDQLEQINSTQGYTMHFPVIDGMELRFGVKGENDENDSSGTIIVDYATPYYKAESVASDFLSTDILEGEWTMTATDLDGKPLETTVNIIRSLKEGRDYQPGSPREFIEQVEEFNQKRLADKNSLLIQGWFLDSKWGENGPYAFRSPYDLLMADDYNASTYQQLFFAAGPKIFMEMNPDGKFVIVSDVHRYMPVESWGLWLYLGGVYANRNAIVGNYSTENPSQIEFPVTISDDNKTLTIEPVNYDGTTYYLNILRLKYDFGLDVSVNSSIILKKK